jgi:hypothetical protein
MAIGIVPLAFGTPRELPVNQHIGRTAGWIARMYKAPICTQVEVPIDMQLNVTYLAGAELPTLQIARSAVEWAKRTQLDELRLVCALPHLWRARRDFKAAAREAGYALTISTAAAVYEPYPWFSRESTQPRTRSWWAYNVPRDLLLRTIFRPFWIYKRLPGNS